jgi:pimeloyl-ACP methyl ester carboxylesterase
LSSSAHVNGIDLHYSTYGDTKAPPLIFLHGGMGNSENWGNQVGAFAERYRVILIDSRGHGRSTRDARPFGYDLMADDVIALMDELSVRKASIVGWSDGGNIGLSIALRYPERLDRLFAFGANSDPSGVMPPDEKNPVFALLMPRLAEEYRRLSPTPDKFEIFSAEIGQMWATQPRWSEADLARIRNPVAIADGDHEEMIFRTHTEQLTRQIPGAQLILLRDVSHFAPFQDPAQFNEAVHNFLEAPDCPDRLRLGQRHRARHDRGLFEARPRDTVGLAVACGYFSDALQRAQQHGPAWPDGGTQDHETLMELTYWFDFRNSEFFIQPNL